MTLDGVPVPQWQPVTVPAGGVLDVGDADRPGLRCYVLVAGGLQEPDTSAASHVHARRVRRPRRPGAARRRRADGRHRSRTAQRPSRARAAIDEQPSIGHRWELAVTEGPHAAPEFFTRADIDTLVGTD